MAKYTIISLILIDFVPIFFIFNLIPDRLGGVGPCDEGLEHELCGVLLGDHL